jgi:hypothetical protein
MSLRGGVDPAAQNAWWARRFPMGSDKVKQMVGGMLVHSPRIQAVLRRQRRHVLFDIVLLATLAGALAVVATMLRMALAVSG